MQIVHPYTYYNCVYIIHEYTLVSIKSQSGSYLKPITNSYTSTHLLFKLVVFLQYFTETCLYIRQDKNAMNHVTLVGLALSSVKMNDHAEYDRQSVC